MMVFFTTGLLRGEEGLGEAGRRGGGGEGRAGPREEAGLLFSPHAGLTFRHLYSVVVFF